MQVSERHLHKPKRTFDGGDLDCGNGLLLLIRENLDRLEPGQTLEILSRESSVEEDLPAWCRLTGNELVSWTKVDRQRSYLVSRGKFDSSSSALREEDAEPFRRIAAEAAPRMQLQFGPAVAHQIPALSVMGVGSWPRPLWLMPFLHRYLEGRISESEFNAVADDAVRLSVFAQLGAGADVISDGEQRRDSYAGFVAGRLNGCQLIPLTDLLPLVDEPQKFQEELRSLDVPADKVRHPFVKGRLSRKEGGIAVRELLFLRSVCRAPLKIALPGPYLLSRTMWMDCITDKAYESRRELANDIVAVLREEISELLAAGASCVQLDEPVLSEVVFSSSKNTRSFMCGALSERDDAGEELSFASELINKVCAGFPPERLGLHICRGNWTPDESVALSGGYSPLLDFFNSLRVGTLFLEFCTPRAGDISVLKSLREDFRVGLGAVNQKSREFESVDSIVSRVNSCIDILGPQRLFLNPDCGFATFADNPVSSVAVAQSKLSLLSEAAAVLRKKYGLPSPSHSFL